MGGFADGDVVDVVSEAADGVRAAGRGVPPGGLRRGPGTCAAYFPEANVLVPLDSVADESNTPVSKAIIVRFEAR